MPYKDKARNRVYQSTWAANKKASNPAFAALLTARRQRNLELRLNFANDVKTSLKCFYCSEDDPALLDFHHLDETRKVATVSQMVRGRYAIALIVDEISKCLCVCRNHHASMSQLRCDFINVRKRHGMDRMLLERKRREQSLLIAKRYLQATHPNVQYRGNVPKMLRFVFGS